MSKDWSGRYYQESKEKIQKPRSSVRYKILLKKKKTENKNMVVNDLKISQKIKDKG